LRAMRPPVVKFLPKEGIVRLQVAMEEADKSSFYENINFLHPIEGTLPFCLGETEEGNPFWLDLATNPHSLVAGQTGSGKSAFLHTLIANAFCLKDRKINISLVDPKQVEFQTYKDAIFANTIKSVSSTYDNAVELLYRY